jgi:diguanylate cyclase (GGDEF)-like protein
LVRFADGRTFERDYVPIVSQGRPAGQVWTYRDVTERVRDREALEQSSARNRRLAIFDEMTGLHNRRGFHLAADHHLKVARRGEQQAVIFFMDIDGLKKINDTYGHVSGDQAIRDMANILTETFRDTDVVGRLGGDEFAAIASMPPQAVTATRIRVRQHLDEFNALNSRPYRLETSIGAALYIEGDTVDSLLSRADTAMYLEKRAGSPS